MTSGATRPARLLAGLGWVALAVPAAAALLVTAARVADLDSGPAVRLQAFTPLALPLYLLVLLGALAGALARRPRRTACLAVAAGALAGAVLHAWWLAPLYLGRTPAPAAGATEISVMSLNLYEGRADAERVVELVRAHDVDLLVLVEVTPGALAAVDAAGLAGLLPSRTAAPGPDPWDSGTVVLAREPVGEATPVATYHPSWLVQVGDLRVLAAHPIAPVHVERWRADHAVLLEAVRSARPDLVLGDLNATDDQQPLRALAGAGWRDVAEVADQGWQPTWPANRISPVPALPLPPLVRIDHVLVGPGVAALGSRTAEVPGTDHLAVLARVAGPAAG